MVKETGPSSSGGHAGLNDGDLLEKGSGRNAGFDEGDFGPKN
jgi:hypothetical protein